MSTCYAPIQMATKFQTLCVLFAFSSMAKYWQAIWSLLIHLQMIKILQLGLFRILIFSLNKISKLLILETHIMGMVSGIL